jgi:hypothetical protein
VALDAAVVGVTDAMPTVAGAVVAARSGEGGVVAVTAGEADPGLVAEQATERMKIKATVTSGKRRMGLFTSRCPARPRSQTLRLILGLIAFTLCSAGCSKTRLPVATTPSRTATEAPSSTPRPISTPTAAAARPAAGDQPATNLDGLTIAMDGAQYNIGDKGGFCYTVPGPGQVTITNNGSGGTIQLLSVRDSGSGACNSGAIQGPAGRYCVVILYAGAAGVGTAQNCYQVFDPSSTS